MKPALNTGAAIAPQPVWFKPGAFNPLFDRLVDQQEGNNIPVTLNKDQLKNSILKEIFLLFNTRCKLKVEDYKNQMTPDLTWGIPDLYGLPDFSGLDPADQSTWIMIQEAIQNALRIFESRLKNPQVIIQKFENSKQSLSVQVQGIMTFENLVEPIEFLTVLR